MHAIRDPSLFSVRLELPDPLPAIDVPPMLLLPLAENAMKHGPLARHKGEVVLRVTLSDGAVCIELSNPGVFKGPRDGGSGLASVKRRLALTVPAGASFVIEAEGTDRTRAVVVVPALAPAPVPG